MAHNPNGPPPPYYGYPPGAPGPVYAYVPTPVMMPGYPPMPPAYQPGPVHVVNHSEEPLIDWVPVTPTTYQDFAHRAVVAGKEGWDNSPLWVIRSHHSGECVPGKLAAKHRSAYIPFAGKEVPVHNFEVLCAAPNLVRWSPASKGSVPEGALPAGNTHNGEPLYVGRAMHRRSITPGKVHPSHGCLYISFDGQEVPIKQYEVLCRA